MNENVCKICSNYLKISGTGKCIEFFTCSSYNYVNFFPIKKEAAEKILTVSELNEVAKELKRK